MGDKNHMLVERINGRFDGLRIPQVEESCGFIEDDQLRAHHQNTRECHQLLFAAGELVRETFGEMRDAEPIKCGVNACLPFVLRELEVLQPEFEVFRDDRVDDLVVRVLEDEADIATQVFRLIRSRKPHSALGRFLQTVQQPCKGAFARPVATDDPDAPLAEFDRHIFQDVPAGFFDRDGIERDHRSMPAAITRPSGCPTADMSASQSRSPVRK